MQCKMAHKNLNLISFCNGRVSDIENLLKVADAKSTTGQQERRRTTAHFRFRFSRKHSTNESKSKKRQKLDRCRKHMRRSRAIMANSGDNSIRLGTHLFNSRRMKMSKMWGYILPTSHAGRGLNALKDILQFHCSLADRSYCQPIDISGTQKNIISLLENFVVCKIFDRCCFIVVLSIPFNGFFLINRTQAAIIFMTLTFYQDALK